MTALRFTLRHGSDWTIDAAPVEGGIGLTIGLVLDGGPVTLTLGLDRAEARELARGILRATGDASERTFPHPPIPEADHG